MNHAPPYQQGQQQYYSQQQPAPQGGSQIPNYQGHPNPNAGSNSNPNAGSTSNPTLNAHHQPPQYSQAGGGNPAFAQPRQVSPHCGSEPSENEFFRSSFPANATTQLGLQIGSQMIHVGQDFVAKNISNYMPQGMLKTYFNVTNTYVFQKVLIILFPFRHKAWQRSVMRDTAGQSCGFQPPRHDLNSPDLYIPLMAATTYILLVGMILGLRNAFHPKQLGVTATGAVAFIVCELVLVKLGAYLLSLSSDVFILDMLAIIGYNFIPLIVTMSVDLFFGRMAKWLAFLYCGLAMGFFMLRSLRYSFLPDSSSPLVVNQRRTRVLFLFGVVCVQILCSCLLLM